MKKLLFLSVFCAFFALSGISQKTSMHSGSGKSWLKIGIEPSIPVGDISDGSNFALGGVLAGQWLANPHFGVGVASGYTHYFAKNDGDGIGAIPLNLLLRYYPKASGIFAGGDIGYSFLTDVKGKTGGFTFKPEVGYHNYSWNFYAFYNQVTLSDGYGNLQTIGVGAIYNLRFKN